MKRDAFSAFHPAVNFIFFLGAIGFGVVLQHPAYLLAGCVFAAVYYLLLTGRKGIRMILAMLPLFLVLSAINPFFNHYGETVLATVFGKPYTLEALFYGMAVAAMFVAMLLWFGCYDAVMTSDKFTSLFGNLIPALSLLLVMIFRLVPNLLRKARQISGARRSLGLGAGEQETVREKLNQAVTVLGALTDWALEGSIITADSMRARGYGTARRVSFMIYRMTGRDWVLLVVEAVLAAVVIVCAALGHMNAAYTPVTRIAPLTFPGFTAYCVYLSIPTLLHMKEALQWHILRSRI